MTTTSKNSAYQSLARKYRPGTFKDLVGQDSTALALANAIRMGREPHAVIFSGVRGIGKTTTARLYAKALNCVTGPTAEPCDQCESCRAISLGNHEDVVEIDGASNTSVDNIRSLRDTINYLPQRSKFKVYIIDEVHMLSQSAFNALLKTLEEPPAQVVFVFATTEMHKIPQTIVSRCQVFFLKRFSIVDIKERLETVLKSEGIPFDDQPLSMIAREGHGSMRDALTLLDHVIAIGNGKVTLTAINEIISHVSTTPFLNLLEAIIFRNSPKILSALEILEKSGVDAAKIAEKTAELSRHASIAKDIGPTHIDFKALGFDDEETKYLVRIASESKVGDLRRIFRTLVKALGDLDGSPIDNFILENYLLEWCLDPGMLFTFSSSEVKTPGPTLKSSALAEKPSVQGVALRTPDVKIIVKGSETSENDSLVPQQMAPVKTEQAAKQLPAIFPESWKELVDAWKRLKPLQARKLEEAHPILYSPQKIELVVPEGSYASASLLRIEDQKKLREEFADLFSFKGQLVVVKGKTEQSNMTSPPLPESLASLNQKEDEIKRQKIESSTREHPLTKEVLEIFNGQLEDIQISDNTSVKSVERP
ncbi:MAG: DNA polymerase III subunit gamma/tau [Proteobacteria bacterium]|nr:DNA polymerase III subunit gamma/tau [Pseudomonadota bacterium]